VHRFLEARFEEPFAFVGGVFAVALTGRLLSLGSLVGFVTLFGITLRNSILMISHYEHLVIVGGRVWGLRPQSWEPPIESPRS
jgi:Cu/Ag efflux pump CusA